MSTPDGAEEFISLCVVVFDTEAGTLRYASAGHPPAWLWHDREVRPLRSTGPLLMLDPDGSYLSREIPLDVGDLVLLYTDGLAEARDGEQLFGEERIANTLRRDPGVDPDVLCKSLLEAARDFASVAAHRRRRHPRHPADLTRHDATDRGHRACERRPRRRARRRRRAGLERQPRTGAATSSPRQGKLFVRDRLDLLLDEGSLRRGRLLANAVGRRPAGRRRRHRRRPRSTAGRCA